MPAGSRTELIEIERETRTKRADAGFDTSWSVVGALWAAAEYGGGSEGEARGAVRHTRRLRFVVLTEAVRALAVTPADRIRWQGQLYNIREVPPRLATAGETAIVAESGVTQ